MDGEFIGPMVSDEICSPGAFGAKLNDLWGLSLGLSSWQAKQVIRIMLYAMAGVSAAKIRLRVILKMVASGAW